jgi:hypothetical protein
VDVSELQIVVLFGTPPLTPAVLQFVARLGANTPVHGLV